MDWLFHSLPSRLYFASLQLFFRVLVSFLLFPFLPCTLRGFLLFLFELHCLTHLLVLHHLFFFFSSTFFHPTALNFPSVVLLNEITARAAGVDVADTRMSEARGAAISILSVSCGRRAPERRPRTRFLSPPERSALGLLHCAAFPVAWCSQALR